MSTKPREQPHTDQRHHWHKSPEWARYKWACEGAGQTATGAQPLSDPSLELSLYFTVCPDVLTRFEHLGVTGQNI